MIPENIEETIKQKEKEFRSQIVGYIVAALGLVAGLAWNEAIRSLIDYLFPFSGGNGLAAKFVYAALVTIVIVLVSSYLIRVGGKRE